MPRDKPPWGVMTLNLHCFKLEDTTFSTNAERWTAIANFVESEGIDVLLLQEVCETTSEKAIE